MANATNGRADEVAQLVAAQVEVARKQVDYHLSRSRVAASARVPGARTPVRPVLDGLVRVMRRIHADRELELEVASPGQAIDFRGEEQDLQEMLGNLLDNACKTARALPAMPANECSIGASVRTNRCQAPASVWRLWTTWRISTMAGSSWLTRLWAGCAPC
jgi:signal transduction histidine kinase